MKDFGLRCERYKLFSTEDHTIHSNMEQHMHGHTIKRFMYSIKKKSIFLCRNSEEMN
jgi:hypothetical protein